MTSGNRLSENDARILDVLQRDGRRPYADLGADVGMSGPSAHERVKKLESRGVIQGYAATRDLERVLRAVRATPNVFQTETDVVFSSGFERRPLHVPAETDDASGT